MNTNFTMPAAWANDDAMVDQSRLPLIDPNDKDLVSIIRACLDLDEHEKRLALLMVRTIALWKDLR